ncbi:MAG TPA: 3'-5' exonuclease [Nevskia sp.]|nr:3'-5' exonuclease [Nevskia sp.]
MNSELPIETMQTESTGDIRLCDAVFRVIDTEGTDKNPVLSRVCELAFVDVSARGHVSRTWCSLINPGVPIPPSASAVHHLTDADVAQAPRLHDFRDLLEVPVLAAHNADYDSTVLSLPASALVVDTERLAKHLWADIGSYGLQECRYYLQLKVDLPPRGGAHTALGDAVVTAALLVRCLAEAAAQWPDIRTVKQLIRRISTPVLLKYTPFRNREVFAHCSTDHLQWIVDRGAGGEDCVFTASHHLKQRWAVGSDFEVDEAES